MKKNHTLSLHSIFFFFFLPQLFYWDIVITVRKITIVIIATFFSAPLQIFVGGGLLLASYSVYRAVTKDVTHGLEAVSLSVLFLTLFAGKLYYNNTLPSRAWLCRSSLSTA